MRSRTSVALYRFHIGPPTQCAYLCNAVAKVAHRDLVTEIAFGGAKLVATSPCHVERIFGSHLCAHRPAPSSKNQLLNHAFLPKVTVRFGKDRLAN